MKNAYKNIISLILTIAMFSACEEVIDIEIENLDQRIVIDGMITDNPELNLVKIGITQNIFLATAKTKVKGAIVTISDDKGNSNQLSEIEPGIYSASSIKGIPGSSYSLRVAYNNNEYTAVSKMPDAIKVDSISFEKVVTQTFPYIFGYYSMKCYISNVAGKEDYCMIKISSGSNNYNQVTLMYSDQYSDGKQVVFDKISAHYAKNDVANVEVYTMDKNAYEFYRMLNELSGGDDIELPEILNMNSYNPRSNISNNALGFFGAFSYRKYSVTVGSNSSAAPD